jgi:hypothetical protein
MIILEVIAVVLVLLSLCLLFHPLFLQFYTCKHCNFVPEPFYNVFIRTGKITIFLSPKTLKIGLEDFVKNWVKDLVDFWKEHSSYTQEQILNALSDVEIVLKDQPFFYVYHMEDMDTITTKKCVGYAHPTNKKVGITTLSENIPSLFRIKSLMRHELSHIIIQSCNPQSNADTDHQLFLDVGLEED